MKRLILLTIVALSLMAAPANAASIFGIAPHVPDMTQAQDDRLASTGADNIRVVVNINNVRRSDGTYNWTLSDDRIYKGATAQLQPIVILSGLTTWTTQTSAQWRSFVDAIVQRYKPGGTFWQQHPTLSVQPVVWVAGNEPNVPRFWKGTVGQFASLVQSTANVAHQEQYGAKVVVGGMSPSNGVQYLSQVLPRVKASSIFGVAYHPYAPAADGATDYVRRVRSTLLANNMGTKSILIDEVGWSTQDIGEQAQADRMQAFFKSMHSYQSAWHIYCVLWYGFQDSDTGSGIGLNNYGGLFRVDGTAKPSWTVFKSFARL